MENRKKGFIFYFDNYPMLAELPMEQRGLLFSVLMVYADRVWRDTSVTLEEVMDGFPALTQETRVACGFMGAAIYRDTLAWLNRRDQRQKRKQDQRAASAGAEQRAREDMERTRRLMEQLKQEQA